jgi:hypothetical protein
MVPLPRFAGAEKKFDLEPRSQARFNLTHVFLRGDSPMIRKLPSGKYRLYSRKMNPKTGKRRNLGTFDSRAAAEKHERAVQYFKRH